MKRLITLVVLLIGAWHVHGQASWEKFGQNRVQYQTFEWQYFDSTHFRAFYYGTGKAHAIYSLAVAEQELQRILNLMGGRVPRKLNIIIYNNFGEFKQTNLGRKNEEINAANGGVIHVLGENIPIYFNGDHTHLRKQIMKSLASIIKDNMLFGDNFKEVVKNTLQMNLPSWYTDGYVDFISSEWNTDDDDEIYNLLMSSKHPNFYQLSIQNPIKTGRSFWNYINTKYGDGQVSNLLYQTRYRKTVNDAIELTLHKTKKEFYEDWKNYYLHRSNSLVLLDSIKNRMMLTRITGQKGSTYSQFTLSPMGRELAFVEKREGQFFIYIHDVKYHKTFKILEGGLRVWSEMADPDYPMLSWSASGDKMAILYQRNNFLYLRTYSAGTHKMTNRAIPTQRIERITSMCFTPEENAVAITGIKKGQSDLFSMALKNNRVTNTTTDLFDDRGATLSTQGQTNGVLFLSNRKTPYIGENAKSDDFNDQFNLFLYRPSKGTNLLQLTQTTKPVLFPIPYGDEDFSILQEEGGKLVRKILHIEHRTEGDTVIMYKSAPSPYHILKQEYVQTKRSVVDIVRDGKDFVVFQTSVDSLIKEDKVYHELHPVDSALTDVVAPKDTLPEYRVWVDTAAGSDLDSIFLEKRMNSNRYLLYTASHSQAKSKKYTANFYPDNLSASLDNTILFNRYQPFTFFPGSYQNPPVSGFMGSSLTDIMEDYKINGGVRLGSSFTTLDYFVQFKNYRKRLDWGLLYFHHTSKVLVDLQDLVPPGQATTYEGKVTMNYVQSDFCYPLDILRSFRLQVGARRDRITVPAVNSLTASLNDYNEYWNYNRLEYVYDNTTSPLLNIWKGSRAKFFAEYQYKLNNGTKGFYNFGYDGRYYQPIYKNIILASRIAGAHSGGNAKILYLVGGVDNDVNPKYDANSIIDTSQHYAFQTLATNLRGYRQGFRKGNSFIVVNEEIRLPIWNTFFRQEVKSGFLRYLQLVLFTDIGSSWNGIMPNGDNIKLPSIVNGNPVTVIINSNKYDFGLGYGTGLRTRLLGYFLRTDVAWSVEGKNKPILHVSLATDF